MSALKEKEGLLTLAGGAAGALITWNAGGAIVGAFVADVVSLTTVKYEEKLLEDREEASRRLKDRFKAEEKKDSDKKAEKKKEEEKKAEEVKGEDKKADRKKEEEKKAEEVKGEDKKADRKKEEDRTVHLFIEDSITSRSVKAGSMAEADVQYTLLAPSDMKRIKITETRILHAANKRIELDKREVVRVQGTYASKIKFKVPEDVTKGYCIVYTTITDGTHSKTTKSVINII